jgi:hypothetical protein
MCVYLSTSKKTRESLVIADIPGLGDPFAFDYNEENGEETEFQRPSKNQNRSSQENQTTNLA